MLEMQLDISDFEDIMNLYIEVLKNDLYYVHRFPNKEEREKKMREIIASQLSIYYDIIMGRQLVYLRIYKNVMMAHIEKGN